VPVKVQLLANWWLQARKQVQKAHRKGFSTTVLLVAWSNWKKGDSTVFDYVALQPVTLAQKIWVKADLAKARLQGLPNLWLAAQLPL
jgi:hypothetical protein